MRAAALMIASLIPAVSSATTFRNPLDPAQCAWSGGCYVTAYFDLNRTSGPVRDWACGTKTYDNHGGVDIGIGGFTGMAQGRNVHAAADGTVIGAHDGEFDQCTSGACGASNYVWIEHPDGKVTLYYHLKKGSVAVTVGQKVTCGQVIGQVGSSGYSTGPHLHFQVNAVKGDPNSFDDPYAGTNSTCGGPLSWWVSQGSYLALPGYACEPKPLADMVVSSVSVAPASPVEGELVELRATVKNVGTAATTAQVGVGFLVDGAQVSFAIRPAMAAGESAELVAQAKWTAVFGAHTVEAFVDDVNRFAEEDEGNNKRAVEVNVAQLPDLFAGEVSFTPAVPVEGETVTFTLQVESRRGATAAKVPVQFLVGAEAAAHAVVPPLGASESATVTGTWVAGLGAHELHAVIDPQNALAEWDEQNNASAKAALFVLHPDGDADGARRDADCDDAAASVHPGAAETCNGVDDDCDGSVDELDACSPGGGEAASDGGSLPEVAGGCGCAGGGGGVAAGAVLGALVLLRARRRGRLLLTRPRAARRP